MRSVLLVAVGCLICSSQPGLAGGGFIHLSKPNTSYSAYMNDRSACFTAASYRISDEYAMWTRYNLNEFAGCMTAKGYRLDPNGYRAAWYESYDGQHYYLQLNRPSPAYR